MGIADELITHGWGQGNYKDNEGRLCLLGACGWRAFTLVDGEEERRAAAVAEALGGCGVDAIPRWNDDPERTFDEVLRVAKHADEILDA